MFFWYFCNFFFPFWSSFCHFYFFSSLPFSPSFFLSLAFCPSFSFWTLFVATDLWNYLFRSPPRCGGCISYYYFFFLPFWRCSASCDSRLFFLFFSFFLFFFPFSFSFLLSFDWKSEVERKGFPIGSAIRKAVVEILCDSEELRESKVKVFFVNCGVDAMASRFLF